jgi:hypothetical protein
MSALWVRHTVIRRRRWLKSPVHRREHEAAVKTTRAGKADLCGCTCSDFAHVLLFSHVRLRVPAWHPAFPAPSDFPRESAAKTRTDHVAGMRARALSRSPDAAQRASGALLMRRWKEGRQTCGTCVGLGCASHHFVLRRVRHTSVRLKCRALSARPRHRGRISPGPP